MRFASPLFCSYEPLIPSKLILLGFFFFRLLLFPMLLVLDNLEKNLFFGPSTDGVFLTFSQ